MGIKARAGLTMPSPQNVTEMLRDWRNGDQEALGKLIPVVYDELRHQAARYLRRERPGHTLQTTALIHEAYLRLINQQNIEWQNRAHFYAIAARLMRQILVDHARKRQATKRGGSDIKIPLAEAVVISPGVNADLVALDEALTRLAALDPQQSRIVELRYFSGLSVEETAEVLGVSSRTVKRDWNVAKAWLRQQIGER
jgi:RNA polymerase sigma factor (TIGR02999 family)